MLMFYVDSFQLIIPPCASLPKHESVYPHHGLCCGGQGRLAPQHSRASLYQLQYTRTRLDLRYTPQGAL